MSSILKPDWWNTWVIQGLWITVLRDGAPGDVKRAFKRFQKAQIKVV